MSSSRRTASLRAHGKLPAKLLAGILLTAGLSYAACRSLGWWIDGGESPAQADAIVVLSGDFFRAPYAGELFRLGYAPEVWLSAPDPSPNETIVRRFGIPYPVEWSVNRELLMRQGVPPSRIRVYGRGVNSTRDEATALAKELDPEKTRVLIVTSCYHARRARRIFRRALPGRDIRVAATSYESCGAGWWRRKDLTTKALEEIFKTAYDLAGVRFLTRP